MRRRGRASCAGGAGRRVQPRLDRPPAPGGPPAARPGGRSREPAQPSPRPVSAPGAANERLHRHRPVAAGVDGRQPARGNGVVGRVAEEPCLVIAKTEPAAGEPDPVPGPARDPLDRQQVRAGLTEHHDRPAARPARDRGVDQQPVSGLDGRAAWTPRRPPRATDPRAGPATRRTAAGPGRGASPPAPDASGHRRPRTRCVTAGPGCIGSPPAPDAARPRRPRMRRGPAGRRGLGTRTGRAAISWGGPRRASWRGRRWPSRPRQPRRSAPAASSRRRCWSRP